jgi:hypothetical protein
VGGFHPTAVDGLNRSGKTQAKPKEAQCPEDAGCDNPFCPEAYEKETPEKDQSDESEFPYPFGVSRARVHGANLPLLPRAVDLPS